MSAPTAEAATFRPDKHLGYFRQCVRILSEHYQSNDINRITLGFFALQGLEVLGKLDSAFPEDRKKGLIDWIYEQQVVSEDYPEHNGFRGGPFPGPTPTEASGCNDNRANVAQTNHALLCLLILGDDLSRVNVKAVTAGLRALQQEDGNFIPVAGSLEKDARFVYSACAVSAILNDWSGVDVEKAATFIGRCQGYDGGIAQGYGLESHGGSTYCGTAALSLMGKLWSGYVDTDRLLRWCLRRQTPKGYQGRVCKPADTCYAFWIGSAIEILGGGEFVDKKMAWESLVASQSSYGGFGKWVNTLPDILHSCLGLGGVTYTGRLRPLAPPLAITASAARRLPHLHYTLMETAEGHREEASDPSDG